MNPTLRRWGGRTLLTAVALFLIAWLGGWIRFTTDPRLAEVMAMQREADRLGVPLLAQIPIDIATREAGDQGLPVTAAAPESEAAGYFVKLAKSLRQVLEKTAEVQ